MRRKRCLTEWSDVFSLNLDCGRYKMNKTAFQNIDNCCGCGACCDICPKNALKLEKNIKGFLYPIFNSDACISCGLCIKVCPMQ